MTEDAQATAIKALLTTAQAAPYDLDEVKALASLPVGYTEVTISPRYVGALRNTGSTGRTGWRVTTRVVGLTIDNARELRKRGESLRYARVTVDGSQSTPIQFESAEPIGEDDGRYSGLATWTYAI